MNTDTGGIIATVVWSPDSPIGVNVLGPFGNQKSEILVDDDWEMLVDDDGIPLKKPR